MTEPDRRQSEFFANRLLRNERVLRRWIRREGIEAVRLYDRDIPEIPLALDRYGSGDECACVLALYRRPYDKDPGLERTWLDLMADTAAKVLGIRRDRVFVKLRERQRGLDQYGKTGDAAFEMTIHEGGLAFIVNLSGYLDTGLFLDHRPLRSVVRAASAGRTVLNLFSYTGSFSVHAAAGGAGAVTSVDLSNTYLAWTRRNLELNGFDARRNPVVRSDVTAFLAAAVARGRTWDVIVADPPTFSNSKRTMTGFDVNRDWSELVGQCMDVLAPGGVLYFSTNSRSLHWDPALVPGTSTEISAATIPPDFRNGRIHRCWEIRAT